MYILLLTDYCTGCTKIWAMTTVTILLQVQTRQYSLLAYTFVLKSSLDLQDVAALPCEIFCTFLCRLTVVTRATEQLSEFCFY